MSEIEAKNSEVNVEEIMKKIRSEIKRKRSAGLYGEDLDEKLNIQLSAGKPAHDLKAQLREMNVHWHVSAEKPIRSDKPFFGFFIVFIKRVIRKMLRWHINDVTEQVSAFNMHSVWAMSEIEDRLTKLEECVKALEKGKSVKEQVQKPQ